MRKLLSGNYAILRTQPWIRSVRVDAQLRNFNCNANFAMVCTLVLFQGLPFYVGCNASACSVASMANVGKWRWRTCNAIVVVRTMPNIWQLRTINVAFGSCERSTCDSVLPLANGVGGRVMPLANASMTQDGLWWITCLQRTNWLLIGCLLWWLKCARRKMLVVWLFAHGTSYGTINILHVALVLTQCATSAQFTPCTPLTLVTGAYIPRHRATCSRKDLFWNHLQNWEVFTPAAADRGPRPWHLRTHKHTHTHKRGRTYHCSFTCRYFAADFSLKQGILRSFYLAAHSSKADFAVSKGSLCSQNPHMV